MIDELRILLAMVLLMMGACLPAGGLLIALMFFGSVFYQSRTVLGMNPKS